ncbi:MAG: amidohydrolase [Atopobiaceae bacterium]
MASNENGMHPAADAILLSKSVFTAENELERPAAVVVRGGRIEAVAPYDGYAAYVGPDTRVIDCGERTVLPGFNDNHVHFFLGAVQNDPDVTLDLSDCTSAEMAVKKVKEFAELHPQNPWIYACGWNEASWPNHEFDRTMLDAVLPDRPCNLVSWDLHTSWVNSKALELIGIDRSTPDKPNGIIDHYRNGEPNGILHEPGWCEPVNAASTVPGDMAATAGKALAKCVRRGITALGTVYPFAGWTDDFVLDSFMALDRAGRLPVRMSVWLPLAADLSQAERLRDEPKTEHVRVAGLKQLVDGVSEMHTAWQTTPYADDPSTSGAPNYTKEELLSLLMNADGHGFSTRLHCIGNASVKMALDCFEEVQSAHGRKDLRNAIEHIETCCPEDIAHFAKLNVIASMQPIHATVSGEYASVMGQQWVPYMWPIKSIADAGGMVAFSSDYPVVEPDPMLEVWSAVTRTLYGSDKGINPSQKVSLGFALRAHTYCSAFLSGTDQEQGTLEPGKLADIAVMDADLFAVPADELKDHEADLVLLGGKTVYSSGALADKMNAALEGQGA